MTEVFAPQGIEGELKRQLDEFMVKHDFTHWYKSYNWERDTHAAGFPDILRLETQLSRHAKVEAGVTESDIRDVMAWGKNDRNISRLRVLGYPPIPGNLLYDFKKQPILELHSKPMNPVQELDNRTQQVGPTYLSKVLRFALPQEYGAIDTRCAEIFRDWVHFTLADGGNGANITKDAKWIRGYPKWINILRYFVHNLLTNCPHPQGFVDAGLRDGKTWTCADVEMALFSYASQKIEHQKQISGAFMPGTLASYFCRDDEDDDFENLP